VMVTLFGVPAVALDGETAVTVGAVDVVMEKATVELELTEMPPLELVTPMAAVPTAVRRLLGMEAVTNVELT